MKRSLRQSQNQLSDIKALEKGVKTDDNKETWSVMLSKKWFHFEFVKEKIMDILIAHVYF